MSVARTVSTIYNSLNYTYKVYTCMCTMRGFGFHGWGFMIHRVHQAIHATSHYLYVQKKSYCNVWYASFKRYLLQLRTTVDSGL